MTKKPERYLRKSLDYFNFSYHSPLLKAQSVLEDFSIDGWIAGGAILREITGESPNDFDVFFSSEEDYNEAISKFWRPKALDCADILKESTYGIKFLYDGFVYNLVKKPYPKPEYVLDEFDLSICQLLLDGEEILCGLDTLSDIFSKQMHVVNPISLGNLFFRLRKYQERGFEISPLDLREWFDNRGLNTR